MNQPATVKVFGRNGSAQAYAIRDFLHRSDVPFAWVELTSDEQAREMGVASANDPRLPVCLFPDGTRMENPTIRQITEKLGWFRDPSLSEYDLAIYGARPAGLAPRSCSLARESVVSSPPASASAILPTGQSSSRAPRSAQPASNTTGSACPTNNSFAGPECTTAPGPARRPFALETSAFSSLVAAIPPGRRPCTFRES